MKNLRSIYALWTPFQQQYYQELIEALSVNSIRTDSQLLQSSLKDVCSKTNIKRPVIRAFIQQVLYDTRIQEARQTYKPPTYLLTGIKELDTLLEGGLLFGEVIELYGESSMHVSNYISHFIASYLLNMKQESVYIYDISGMFEAKHLKRVLQTHNLNDALTKIEYKQTFTMKDIIESLELLSARMAVSDSDESCNPLVIIEEISNLLLLNDSSYLMNRLIDAIKGLTDQGSCIIIKNTMFTMTDSIVSTKWYSLIDLKLGISSTEVVVNKSRRMVSG